MPPRVCASPRPAPPESRRRSELAQQRRRRGSGTDDDDERCPPPRQYGGDGNAGDTLVDDEVLTVGERALHDQRAQQRRRDEGETALERRRQRARADDDESEELERVRAGSEDENQLPSHWKALLRCERVSASERAASNGLRGRGTQITATPARREGHRRAPGAAEATRPARLPRRTGSARRRAPRE